MEGKICSSTQTCRNVNREWTLHIERHPWAKEHEPWWQGLVPPMMRGPGTQPHIGNASKWVFSLYMLYSVLSMLRQVQCVQLREDKQCYNAFNREDKSMVGAVAQYYIHVQQRVLQCVQLRGGQTYDQDSDPNVSIPCFINWYNVFYQGECSYWQGSGPMLFVHIMWPPWKETISHFCDTLEMWILSKEKESSVLVKFFIPTHTLHTLRLVSPWGHPGNPAYPYSIHRRLPYGPETSGGHPTAQRAALQPGDYPYSLPAYPAYPSFRNRHTHGTQHTQSSRRPQGPHRLQDYKTA